MKRLGLLCFVVSLFFSPLHAQPDWSQFTLPYDNDHRAADAVAADWDGDGDMDIVGVIDNVYLWQNEGGENWERRYLYPGGWSDLRVIDLNEDGLTDFIANSEPFSWFENLGNGEFHRTVIFDTNPTDYVQDYEVLDFDRDGDQDILVSYYTSIYWFENEGGAQFTDHYLMNANAKVCASDVDADGDLDLVKVTGSNLAWRENVNMEFLPQGILVQGTFGYPMDLKSADLDNDGDADLVLSSENPGDGTTMRLFENLGGVQFAGSTIMMKFNPWEFEIVDLDNDGDEDLVGGHFIFDFPIAIEPIQNRLLWFENDGTAVFTHHEVATLSPSTFSVSTGDVDGDGDLDVVSTSQALGGVHWWRQPNDYEPYDVRAVVAEDGQVTASWASGEGIPGPGVFNEYEVARDGEWVGTTTDLQFVDQLTDPGTYVYTVRAVFGNGTSAWSKGGEAVWPELGRDDVFWSFNDGLPEGWRTYPEDVESWFPVPAEEGDLFDSGFMFNVNPVVSGYLISPPIDIRDATQIMLTFESYLNSEDMTEWGGLYVSYDGGQTNTRIDAYNEVGYSLKQNAIAAGDANSVLIAFRLSGSFSTTFWAIDNVRVEIERDPMVMELSPVVDVIPADGGQLEYDMALNSHLPYPLNLITYWVKIELPNGNVIGPVFQTQATIPANMHRLIEGVTQAVPGYAPAGTYTLLGYLGYPNNPTLQISDSFEFTKDGGTGSTDGFVFNAADWPGRDGVSAILADGLDVNVQAAALPEAYALQPVYPNPFNASATVTVELPDVSELTVAVYNVA
ncbi:VCBS repeat-containing protein, partial [bacterium]|nr:VCBS repeat-containing protein [bacterium]